MRILIPWDKNESKHRPDRKPNIIYEVISCKKIKSPFCVRPILKWHRKFE